MSNPIRYALLAFSLFTALACGEGGVVRCVDDDAGGGGGADAKDAAGDWSLPELIDDTEPDGAAKDGEPSDALVDGEIPPGAFGAPCDGNGDCDSGYCVEGPEGYLCTQACVDSCPDDYTCKAVSTGATGADVTFLCMPIFVPVCAPCNGDAQCRGGRCVHVDGKARCVAACEANDACARVGFTCQAVALPDGGMAPLCAPATGSCECLLEEHGGGVRSCVRQSALGSCAGLETCDLSAGWIDCSAPEAQEETCNGVDDDCDGVVDEDLPQSRPCDKTVAEIGSCAGLELCAGSPGWVCNAPDPQVEACNYVDDDCDGGIDEDFTTEGQYLSLAHCGACGKGCEDEIVNGSAACELLHGTPVCAVEACDPGFFPINDYQCVLVDVDLCQPCLADVHCGGGLCRALGPDEADHFCTVACGGEEALCPLGYECHSVFDPEGALDEQHCRPENGTCDCVEDVAGVTRPCKRESAAGACYGYETCDAVEGWVGCTANEPVEEACNGFDDDCDGAIDDGLTGAKPCEVAVEGLGSCTGSATCQGSLGWVCDAATPVEEICNGLDDDCDGLSDEDFQINDVYASAAHCGACGVSCEGQIANAVEACDPDGPDGPRCVVESCDPGFIPVGDSLCYAPSTLLCSPCEVDDDCSFGPCLPLEDETFCSLPCGPNDALQGFDCEDFGALGAHWSPDNGSCTCSEATAGLKRPCSNASSLGACVGVETCDPALGWSGCDAPAPSAEICDGLDDNCDGLVDEGLPTDEACTKEVEGVGACEGVRVCRGPVGWDCTAAAPAAESCNYQDDDCDGLTDEGFIEGGQYTHDAHCGLCGNACADTIADGTGVCGGGPADPHCVVGACDPGFFPVGEAACVGAPDVVCSPCVEDAQCLGGVCRAIGGGSSCTRACDAEDPCPAGTTCGDLNGEELCLPDSGSCDCGAASAGIQRLCAAQNEHGLCYGVETCDPGAGGWGACDALIPLPERCNGADDDCDGLVDEGLALTIPCENTGDGAGVGACAGEAVCTGDGALDGYTCLAPTPELEQCNFTDDDCDGLVDEDFADIDPDTGAARYTHAEHCGACGVRCADEVLNGDASCDASEDPPRCVLDACAPGFIQAGPLQCVLAPVLTCQPCDTDAQCAGGVCALLDGASACFDACDPGAPAGCDVGTSCALLMDGGAACVPLSGSCACTEATAGSKRACSASNGFGTCLGFQACAPQVGWGACDAEPASAERCDGQDNDCNGLIDDGLPGTQPCDEDNEHGTCAGEATCYGSAGWVCDAPEARPEACNYQDDDCDGLTDEGFVEAGAYTYDAHCGLCGNDCADTIKDGTGACAIGPAGPRCVVGACDPGFFPIGDVACVAAPDVVCSPCTDDVQCLGGVCRDIDGGSYCTRACDAQPPCPDGTACGDLGGEAVCLPTSGSCDCGAASAGVQRLCSVHNEHGACYGVETCDPDAGGWGTCDAQIPLPESCNGLDDDCDGLVDEDLVLTIPCENTGDGAGVGACAGEAICTGDGPLDGYTCLAPTPAPEACNFTDDDCDGLIDEGFAEIDPDTGEASYTHAEHCGTCGVRCDEEVLNGSATCDASQDPPRCALTSCDPGFIQAGPLQCVFAPVLTCQPCDTEAQCAGGVCALLDGVSACFDACDLQVPASCSAGTSCAQLADGRAACVPLSGSCACTEATAGSKRGCSVSNGHGTCLGFQTCDPQLGWDACDAQPASAEVCDGQDNDCDGLIDDDLPASEPCEEVNEHGTCPGEASCFGSAGWICQAPEPGPEICDYKDNDCDGVTDAPFVTDGRYTDFEHCGACNASCASGYPNATTACDAQAELPSCVVQACDPGYFKLNDVQCIPDVAKLCDACVVDENCIVEGSRCVAVGDEGSFCGLACETQADCDAKIQGYTCAGFGGYSQCVPATGSCTCDGSNPGLQAPCSADFEPAGAPAYTCYGHKLCEAGGWSACTLPDEACNLADDDCDGQTDEGFVTASGGYASDEHCGQCGNDCTLLLFGNASGVCNAEVDPVRCGPVCDPGYEDLDDNPSDCECHRLADDDFPGVDFPDTWPDDLDVNCDGVDGDKDKAIFVAKDGDDAWSGAIEQPKRSIQAGIDAAVAEGKRDVYVATGVFTESITLTADVGVYGGYRSDFRQRDLVLYESAILAPAPVAGLPGAVHAVDLTGGLPGSTVFDGFIVFAHDEKTPGLSSYGVYVRDCDASLRISHNVLHGGAGGKGARGGDGGDGDDGEKGGVGAPAFDLDQAYGVKHCDELASPPTSPGGAGGAFTCGTTDVSGGAGGERVCPALDGSGDPLGPTPSELGAPGINNATQGSGGGAGWDVYHQAYNCEGYAYFGDVEGHDGGDGEDGQAGAAGAGCADTAGQVQGGVWSPSLSGIGGDATSGGGGGGGGSGGGAWSAQSCNSHGFGRDNFGGTGGGGGSAGCAGTGAAAGTGGGGAFTVFVAFTAASASAPSLYDNTIRGGFGGDGGAGGNGGVGGTGGLGGTGGAGGGGFEPPDLTYPAFQGGKGGQGGQGGHGGGGGGGCGGPAYGIYIHGVDAALLTGWSSDNSFSPGAGGDGGLGGFSLASPGTPGSDGAVADTNF
jgi:hypothetical protein